jgi:hypothetical protein
MLRQALEIFQRIGAAEAADVATELDASPRKRHQRTSRLRQRDRTG